MKQDNQLCLNFFKTVGDLKRKENNEIFDSLWKFFIIIFLFLKSQETYKIYFYQKWCPVIYWKWNSLN